MYLCLIAGGHGFDDIRVAGICYRQRANSEVLSAGCAELDVIARVVVHSGLGQHSVVFNF